MQSAGAVDKRMVYDAFSLLQGITIFERNAAYGQAISQSSLEIYKQKVDEV